MSLILVLLKIVIPIYLNKLSIKKKSIHTAAHKFNSPSNRGLDPECGTQKNHVFMSVKVSLLKIQQQFQQSSPKGKQKVLETQRVMKKYESSCKGR